VKTLNSLVAEEYADRMTLLAGDLNATPDSSVLKRLQSSWTVVSSAGNTFPSRQPNKEIDFILYRNAANWQVVETRVVDAPVASDHRPVLAVFQRQQK